jgi:chromosome segregation ATPase
MQLEMVRLETDEPEDASVELTNALNKVWSHASLLLCACDLIAHVFRQDEEIATLRARLALVTRRAEQAEARANEAEDKAVRYKAHAGVMQQVVDNTLKALHDVETSARDVSKLQREVAGLKEERVEMAARVTEYREMIERLSQRDEEHAKEIDRLKGNFSPRDLTLDELIQLENTLDEGTACATTTIHLAVRASKT